MLSKDPQKNRINTNDCKWIKLTTFDLYLLPPSPPRIFRSENREDEEHLCVLNPSKGEEVIRARGVRTCVSTPPPASPNSINLITWHHKLTRVHFKWFWWRFPLALESTRGDAARNHQPVRNSRTGGVFHWRATVSWTGKAMVLVPFSTGSSERNAMMNNP